MTVESLLKVSDLSIEQCKDLSLFLRKKVQYDLEHSKRIVKLCQLALAKDIPLTPTSTAVQRTNSKDILVDAVVESSRYPINPLKRFNDVVLDFRMDSSIKNAFSNIVRLVSEVAQSEREITKQFEASIVEALDTRIKEMSISRKQVVEENNRQIRGLQEQYTILKKSKENHDDLLAQMNEAKDGAQKASRPPVAKERELEKWNTKVIQCQEKYQMAAETLRIADETCKQAQLTYYNQTMPSVLQQLYLQEKSRINHIYETLRNLCGHERNVVELHGKAVKLAIDNLERTDLEGDMEELYIEHMNMEVEDGRNGNPVSVRSLVNPVKAGRVQKRAMNEPWKTRYLVLMGDLHDPLDPSFQMNSGRLYFFESEDALKPRSVVDLLAVEISAVDSDLFPGKPYVFHISIRQEGDDKLPKLTHYLSAESVEDRNDWIAMMQRYSMCCKECIGKRYAEPVSLFLDNVDSVCVDIPQASLQQTSYRDIFSMKVCISEAKDLVCLDSSVANGASSDNGINDLLEVLQLQIPQKQTSYFAAIKLNGVVLARTTTKQKECPLWAEEFFFDDLATCQRTLSISVYAVSKRKEVEIASADVSLNQIKSEIGITKKWDCWLPLSSSIANKVLGSSPSVRVQVTLNEEKIMPLFEYSSFINCLFGNDFEILKVLSKVEKCTAFARDEFARGLVRSIVFTEIDIKAFQALLSMEVSAADDPNILFRANSMATKTIDSYMKLIGATYLRETLEIPIKAIVEKFARDSCEIDPTRLERSDDEVTIKRNQKRLLSYVQLVWDAIQGSVQKCPNSMRETLKSIRDMVVEAYKGRKISSINEKELTNLDNVQYSAVSGFIFLRFFCPAILNPKLFGIVTESIDNNIAVRNLTLVTKVLQNLANLSDFKGKEPHMEFCNQWLMFNMDMMKSCLNQLSNYQESDGTGMKAPIQMRSQIIDLSRELNTIRGVLEQNMSELYHQYEEFEKVKHEWSTHFSVDYSVLSSLFKTLNKLNDNYISYASAYQLHIENVLKQDHICQQYDSLQDSLSKRSPITVASTNEIYHEKGRKGNRTQRSKMLSDYTEDRSSEGTNGAASIESGGKPKIPTQPKEGDKCTDIAIDPNDTNQSPRIARRLSLGSRLSSDLADYMEKHLNLRLNNNATHDCSMLPLPETQLTSIMDESKSSNIFLSDDFQMSSSNLDLSEADTNYSGHPSASAEVNKKNFISRKLYRKFFHGLGRSNKSIPNDEANQKETEERRAK